MKRLYTNGLIITMADQEGPRYTRGSIGVEDHTISYIGTDAIASEYDEVIDLRGKAVLPGLINTHNHAAMTLLRGYADDLPLQTWLEEKMWPIEARFQAEQVRKGTALALVEMIKGGTTCFADMYDHMDQVAEMVEISGMRAVLCRGVIGLGSEQERADKLAEAVSFARQWHMQANGRITTMMSPHSPYTCPPAYIEQIVERAIALQIPIHTHMSETAREVEQNIELYGKRPVEHLLSLGLFTIPTLVAHAVHLTTEEIKMLADYDVKIAHNPGSNLKLGSGIAPIPQMLAAGLRPSLATDGAASNNNLDLLEEIRLAALIHKGVNQNPEAVPAYTALSMGTSYGAEALFLDQYIGTLEVGKKADFITVATTGAHMHPMHDLISHLVYSASRDDVQDMVVDGKIIMRDRACLTLDEEKITYEAARAFAAIQ
ncbi:amidohydrolase [Mechercharimyces sp. CAU 1602]|uniref:amidohydrolase n=1 Tax=Mechercharimyces sp. CAU 1602 TaxID=2973933 RepID=UPI0021610D37|nr:amidohydrolase [Mechercharimyces sp. CAU 1602]MCS1351025.1 amidohydrolase [Mechercharimyces sp. CAU 1602]